MVLLDAILPTYNPNEKCEDGQCELLTISVERKFPMNPASPEDSVLGGIPGFTCFYLCPNIGVQELTRIVDGSLEDAQTEAIRVCTPTKPESLWVNGGSFP